MIEFSLSDEAVFSGSRPGASGQGRTGGSAGRKTGRKLSGFEGTLSASQRRRRAGLSAAAKRADTARIKKKRAADAAKAASAKKAARNAAARERRAAKKAGTRPLPKKNAKKG